MRQTGSASLYQMLRNLNSMYNEEGINILKCNDPVPERHAGEGAEHEILPLRHGLCNLAIEENRIVNEVEVKPDPGYLSCLAFRESELSVCKNGSMIGEMCINPDTKNSASRSDELFIATIAEIISLEKL